MSAQLTIGVPSKGRLQESTQALFARAGFAMERARGGRDYRGTLDGIDGVEVLFLSASEIAEELGRGGLHLGVTGEDLLRERWADADERLSLLTPLGFGSANVVVAVPDVWIDVQNLADLEDVAARFRAKHGRKIRVATKYVNLTRQFFNAHHFVDYRIVESAGATEAAPAAGTAELIVDITTTGSTLVANGLRVLDDGLMLKSSAHLALSHGAMWDQVSQSACALLLRRLAAVQKANQCVEVVFSQAFDAKMIALLKSKGATPLDERVYLPKEDAYVVIEQLMELGAQNLVANTRVVDMIFEQNPPLLQKLQAALKNCAR